MNNETSLVKIGAKSVNNTKGVTVLSVVDALEKTSNALNSYFQYKIEREKTKQLKAQYKAEIKKLKDFLIALQKKIDANLKYYDYQSKENDKQRKVLIKLIHSMKQEANKYAILHRDMLRDKKYDKERILEAGKMVTKCFEELANLVRELKPHTFATIDS